MLRFLLATLTMLPLAAQTPEQRGWAVLEAALKAAGGREKLAAVRDMAFELQSRMATPVGEMNVSSRNQLVFPDTVRQELTLPTGQLVIAFNSSEGWQKGPQGVKKTPANQLRLTLAHLARVNLLYRPPTQPGPVRFVGNESVEGKPCDVIEVTHLGDPLRLYVERSTGDVVKRSYRVENSTGGMANVEEFHSDFREVAGLRLSFQVREVRDGQFARESATANMKLNTGLKAEDLLREFRSGR